MTARDDSTLDLFSERDAQPARGSLSCSIEIAHAMSDALDRCRERDVSRDGIADRMSYLLGEKVTVAMLNAYTATSRETHNISAERSIAFDSAVYEVIRERPLLALQARRAGARVITNDEAALIELGRIHQQERELRETKRALQILLHNKKSR